MGRDLYIVAALVVLNLVSFVLMALDKKRAEKDRWRISEKTLFISAALFGALGAMMGMYMLHHKTRKWYFRVFIPVLFVIQLGITVFLMIHQV